MQKKNLRNKEFDIKLNALELCLILSIRNKFKFTEVVITTRQGVPVRIKEAFRSEDFEDEETLLQILKDFVPDLTIDK